MRSCVVVVCLAAVLVTACGSTDDHGAVVAPVSAVQPTGDPSAALPTVAFRTATEATGAYDVETTLPVVTGVAPDVADAIEAHVAAWVGDEVARFEREDREFRVPDEDPTGFPPGWLTIRGAAGAPTSSLLSLVFTVETMHQGMAHAWTVVEAFTFDLATGAPVTLEELFAPGQDVLGTISAEVVPALVVDIDAVLGGGAEAMVREGAAADAGLLRRFVVDEHGLTIHFDQYQVAPGAAGTQAVTLGWGPLLEQLAPSDALRRALDVIV